MIPKHQQINLWMNMSETPEKKKARLRYDNVFKTAWISIFSWFFILYLKIWLNRFYIQNATECTILRPSKINFIFSWFYHTIFKALTTQILYPKCSRMHHFAFPTAFSLSRVGMYVVGWLERQMILKSLGANKVKGSKQDSQYWLRLHMPEGD